MPILSITKTYEDTEILTEQDLDNIKDGVEDFVNVTKLDADNIQDGSIETALLADASVTAPKIASNAVTTAKILDSNVTTAKIADANVTTAKIADANVTAAKLAADVATAVVPSGTILAFGGTSAPTGFLLCDGSAVSRSTYSGLFTAIGTAFGSGDTTTTFNVPDFRGRFLRGRDAGQSRDPDASGRTAMNTGGNTGDAVGSIQDDAFESHSHNVSVGTAGATPKTLFQDTGSGVDNNTKSTQSTGGSETRPINAYVNYIIKT